jgi:pimeloyl-ACP methyl ester carboxylesterase
MIAGHPWGRHWTAAVPAMFAQGLTGYTDDRLADGPGWVTFDVANITSPVIVLHGARDVICDPIHARHTAATVPNAELRMIDDRGHVSVEDHIMPTIIDILARDT